MRWNSISSPIAAGSSSCLTYTVAVYTVLRSWWWTERPSETCRTFYKNKQFEIIRASCWLYYGNVLRCADLWILKNIKLIVKCFYFPLFLYRLPTDRNLETLYTCIPAPRICSVTGVWLLYLRNCALCFEFQLCVLNWRLKCWHYDMIYSAEVIVKILRLARKPTTKNSMGWEHQL